MIIDLYIYRYIEICLINKEGVGVDGVKFYLLGILGGGNMEVYWIWGCGNLEKLESEEFGLRWNFLWRRLVCIDFEVCIVFRKE